jgi:hypothetical protein
MTSAWHPQSDGQTERMNRTIEQCLRAFTAEHHDKEWVDMLSMVEFAMNNSTNASLKATPFFLVYGEHPITPMAMQLIQEDKIACARAFSFTTEKRQAFQYAMQQLQMAKDRYKSYKDANLKDVSFEVGQEVLLSTVNINKHNYNRKLFPKYIGPFRITAKVNDVAYRLQLPETMTIHDVFHVSLLKAYKAGSARPPPIPLEIEGELEFEVEKILLHREKKVGPKNKPIFKKEYFIKWAGYGPEHCSWEPEAHLKNAPQVLAEYWKHLEELHHATANRPKQVVKRSQPSATISQSKRQKRK